ncbi:unnamed protein product, partial [Allacma fusca]
MEDWAHRAVSEESDHSFINFIFNSDEPQGPFLSNFQYNFLSMINQSARSGWKDVEESPGFEGSFRTPKMESPPEIVEIKKEFFPSHPKTESDLSKSRIKCSR